MSRFDSFFRRLGFAAMLRSHGREVIYTPRFGAGGEGTPLTMILGGIDAVPATDSDGRLIGRTQSAELALSDMPNDAIPAHRDQVRIDEEDWVVHEVLSLQAGKANLRLLRPERAEIGQRGYRRT